MVVLTEVPLKVDTYRLFRSVREVNLHFLDGVSLFREFGILGSVVPVHSVNILPH